MAKNNLGALLKQAKRSGVTNGIEFALGLAFLALNNICDDYVQLDQRAQFFKDTEAEVNRLYKTTLDSVPNGELEDMAEKIVFHVERLRKQWGMDDGIQRTEEPHS